MRSWERSRPKSPDGSYFTQNDKFMSRAGVPPADTENMAWTMPTGYGLAGARNCTRVTPEIEPGNGLAETNAGTGEQRVPLQYGVTASVTFSGAPGLALTSPVMG